MKLLIATFLLAATTSANPPANQTSDLTPTLAKRSGAPGQIESKYNGQQPQDVFLPPISISSFGSKDCTGAKVLEPSVIYGQNVDRPNVRSLMLSRQLLNAESLTFATKADSGSKNRPHRRGSATVEDRNAKTPDDCMKIIETAPTPVPEGMLLRLGWGGCRRWLTLGTRLLPTSGTDR